MKRRAIAFCSSLARDASDQFGGCSCVRPRACFAALWAIAFGAQWAERPELPHHVRTLVTYRAAFVRHHSGMLVPGGSRQCPSGTSLFGRCTQRRKEQHIVLAIRRKFPVAAFS